MFAYILMNGTPFKVDEAYMDEPLDSFYPLYDIHSGEEVGRFQASTLQTTAIKMPGCYIDLYKDRVSTSIQTALDSIDIRSVLRLLVNNKKYIHYAVGPVLMSDLIVREGGQYFAYVNNSQGEPILYAAETALQLRECIRHEIPSAANRSVAVFHDKYFEDALAKLKEYHLANDICALNSLHSHWKDQVSEEPHEHGWHCGWCAENGLDGTHLNNPWASDGSVYDDGSKTTKSIYIK